MIGIIPRPLHAVLDYLWGIAVLMAPELFGFADDKAANAYFKARGGSMIGVSLFTRYELGLIKVLPFNMHLLGDLLGALVGLASPQLFGYEKNEKAVKANLFFSLFELSAVMFSKRDRA